MKCLAALSIATLLSCTAPVDPPARQPEGGTISAPSVIATEDGIHVRDTDGSWGFIGMPEPNPPSIAKGATAND